MPAAAAIAFPLRRRTPPETPCRTPTRNRPRSRTPSRWSPRRSHILALQHRHALRTSARIVALAQPLRRKARQQVHQRGAHAGDHADLVRMQILASRRSPRMKPGSGSICRSTAAVRQQLQRLFSRSSSIVMCAFTSRFRMLRDAAARPCRSRTAPATGPRCAAARPTTDATRRPYRAPSKNALSSSSGVGGRVACGAGSSAGCACVSARAAAGCTRTCCVHSGRMVGLGRGRRFALRVAAIGMRCRARRA